MTNSFMKGMEQERKYRNRDAKDCLKDEEFKKFQEEQKNTQKMSTILRSLNSNGIKRKAVAAKRMENEFTMNRRITTGEKARPEFQLTKGTVRESVIEAEEEQEDESQA